MSNSSSQGRGFDLRKIELFRFMNYHTPVKFDFNSPYIVISGPTGSGKTTILDALTFALFGRSSRLDLGMVKIEDICRKNGRVICEFETGINKVRIIRGRDTKGKSYVNLFLNGKRYPGRIPEINEKVRSTILGMNYISFVNSTIIRQDEMKSLGAKSSTKRLQTLQNLFRLDIFEKASSDAQQQLSVVTNNKSKLEGELQEKENQFSRISDLEVALKTKQKHVKNYRQELKDLIKSIEELKKKESILKASDEEFRASLSNRKKSQQQLDNLAKDYRKFQKELKEYKSIFKQYQALEDEVKTIGELEEEIRDLEVSKKDHDVISKQIDALVRNSEKIENEIIENLNKTRRKLEQNIKRVNQKQETTIDHTEAFKLLNFEGRLLERIQRISKEKTWEISDKIFQEIQNEEIIAKEELEKTQNEKKKISKDSFVLSELQQRITELKEEEVQQAKRLENVKRANRKKILEEERKLAKIEFTNKREKYLEDLKKKFQTEKNKKEKFEVIKQGLKQRVDPSGKLEFAENKMKEREVEIKEYDEKLKKYPSFKKEYDELLSQLAEKNIKEKKYIEKIANLEGEIRKSKQEIEKIRQLQPEIEKLTHEISLLRREIEILEKLRSEVFHTKGAPFFAINKILPRLGRRASLILADLTDNRFTHIQLEKRGTGFEILLKVPEGTRDVATFSGGERTQINAALRLAISEEISELSLHEGYTEETKKTLFIDEGDLGSLDTVQAQQAFVKKLFNLTNRFKIILITHLTEVANQFPYSININRDKYGRSVREEPM